MSNCEENNLANLFLDISKKLFENFFDYIYNDKHNKLISDIAWKIHKTLVDENIDFSQLEELGINAVAKS